jgi:hypothetical protein
MKMSELKALVGYTERSDPPPIKYRRIAVVYVTHEEVIRIAGTGPAESSQFVHFPVLDLPAGVRVEQVYLDHLRGAFGFVLEHESFEPVPDGISPPKLERRYKVVEVRKKEES